MPGQSAPRSSSTGQEVWPRTERATTEQIEDLRTRLLRAGLDLGGASDEDIRLGMQLRGEMFRDNAPMTAAQAAAVIIAGMRANEWRILVGDDAFALDEMVRESPSEAYDDTFVERLKARQSSASASDVVAVLYLRPLAPSQRTAATPSARRKFARWPSCCAQHHVRDRGGDRIVDLLPRQVRLGVGWATISTCRSSRC